MAPVPSEPSGGRDSGGWALRYGLVGPRALYLHLPFCVSKCAYCDFPSWATRRGDPLMAGYARALARQVEALSRKGLLAACETAYLGGGTPSLLGPDALPPLVEKVASCSGLMGELTFEANPESLAEGLAAGAREAGATRVSLGVQSLDDGELACLGRAHDAREARRAVGLALSSGLSTSLDLMCAIPRQTDESWGRTLSAAVDLGVGHVSVYPLQIEEGTALERRLGDSDPAWNDPDVQADRMSQAERALTAAGLSRYEVASYARPGRACRHNLAYWQGLPYLGLGTGAASMVTRGGYRALRDLCPRLPGLARQTARVRLRVLAGRSEVASGATMPDGGLSDLDFEVEELTFRQALAEDLMLGARLAAGVDAGLLALSGQAFGDALSACLEEVQERGLALQATDGNLRPTERGWLLGNELYGALWGLASEDDRA